MRQSLSRQSHLFVMPDKPKAVVTVVVAVCLLAGVLAPLASADEDASGGAPDTDKGGSRNIGAPSQPAPGALSGPGKPLKLPKHAGGLSATEGVFKDNFWNPRCKALLNKELLGNGSVIPAGATGVNKAMSIAGNAVAGEFANLGCDLTARLAGRLIGTTPIDLEDLLAALVKDAGTPLMYACAARVNTPLGKIGAIEKLVPKNKVAAVVVNTNAFVEPACSMATKTLTQAIWQGLLDRNPKTSVTPKEWGQALGGAVFEASVVAAETFLRIYWIQAGLTVACEGGKALKKLESVDFNIAEPACWVLKAYGIVRKYGKKAVADGAGKIFEMIVDHYKNNYKWGWNTKFTEESVNSVGSGSLKPAIVAALNRFTGLKPSLVGVDQTFHRIHAQQPGKAFELRSARATQGGVLLPAREGGWTTWSGHKLTVSETDGPPDHWEPQLASLRGYAWSWQRCDKDYDNCEDSTKQASGADNVNYAVSDKDVGKVVRAYKYYYVKAETEEFKRTLWRRTGSIVEAVPKGTTMLALVATPFTRRIEISAHCKADEHDHLRVEKITDNGRRAYNSIVNGPGAVDVEDQVPDGNTGMSFPGVGTNEIEAHGAKSYDEDEDGDKDEIGKYTKTCHSHKAAPPNMPPCTKTGDDGTEDKSYLVIKPAGSTASGFTWGLGKHWVKVKDCPAKPPGKPEMTGAEIREIDKPATSEAPPEYRITVRWKGPPAAVTAYRIKVKQTRFRFSNVQNKWREVMGAAPSTSLEQTPEGGDKPILEKVIPAPVPYEVDNIVEHSYTANVVSLAGNEIAQERQGAPSKWGFRVSVGSLYDNISLDGSATSSRILFPQAPPDAPVVSAPVVEGARITLSWANPATEDPDGNDATTAGNAGITGYQYRYRPDPLALLGSKDGYLSRWRPIPGGAGIFSYEIPKDMDAGETYHIQVRALGAAGTGGSVTPSSPSAEVAASIAPPAAAPANLTAETGDGSVTLSWDAPAAAAAGAPAAAPVTGYQYRLRAGSAWDDALPAHAWQLMTVSAPAAIDDELGAVEEVPLVFAEGAEPSYAVTATANGRPLVNGVGYVFQLRATNAVTIYGDPAEVAAVPDKPPPAPQGLTAAAGDGSVTLAWDAPDTSDDEVDVTGWQYRRRLDFGGWDDARPAHAWELMTVSAPAAIDDELGAVEEVPLVFAEGAEPSYAVTTAYGVPLENAGVYVFQVRALNGTSPGAAAEVAARPCPEGRHAHAAGVHDGDEDDCHPHTAPPCELGPVSYQAVDGDGYALATAPACPREDEARVRFASGASGAGFPASGRTVTAEFADGYAETIRNAHDGSDDGSDDGGNADGWRSDWQWQACEHDTADDGAEGDLVCELRSGDAGSSFLKAYTPTQSDAGKRLRAYVYYAHPELGTRYAAVTALTAAVSPAAPEPPEGLEAEPGAGSVTLTWDDPGDPTIGSHKIRWKPQETGGGPNGGRVDEYPDSWRTITGVSAPAAGKRSYTQDGLSPGVEYTFQILAVNAAGPSDPSNEAAAAPLEACPDGEHRHPGGGAEDCHPHPPLCELEASTYTPIDGRGHADDQPVDACEKDTGPGGRSRVHFYGGASPPAEGRQISVGFDSGAYRKAIQDARKEANDGSTAGWKSSWHWQACAYDADDGGDDGRLVCEPRTRDPENSYKYTPTAADAGKHIRAHVFYNRPADGARVVAVAASPPLPAAPDAPTGLTAAGRVPSAGGADADLNSVDLEWDVPSAGGAGLHYEHQTRRQNPGGGWPAWPADWTRIGTVSGRSDAGKAAYAITGLRRGAAYQVRLRARPGGADGPPGPAADPPAEASTAPLCLLDDLGYTTDQGNTATVPACPRDAARTVSFTAGGARPIAGREITVGFTNGVAGFKAALAGWQRRGGETPDVVHAGWVNTSTGWRSDWRWEACHDQLQDADPGQDPEPEREVCGPAAGAGTGYRFTPAQADAGKRIRAHVYYVHPTLGTRHAAVAETARAVRPGKPDPPRDLRAEPAAGSVTLTWDDPGDASITSHKIHWKPSEIRGGQKVDEYTRWRTIPDGEVSVPAAGKRSYTQDGLSPGVEYTFQILAENAAGDSDPSNEAAAAPLEACPDGEHRDGGTAGCHPHPPLCELEASTYTPIDGRGHADDQPVDACEKDTGPGGRSRVHFYGGASPPAEGRQISVGFDSGAYRKAIQDARKAANDGSSAGWKSSWHWQACAYDADDGGDDGRLVCEPRTRDPENSYKYTPTAADAGKHIRAHVFYNRPADGARVVAVAASPPLPAAAAPDAPTGFTAAGGDPRFGNGDKVKLRWDVPSGGDGLYYEHQIRRQGTGGGWPAWGDDWPGIGSVEDKDFGFLSGTRKASHTITGLRRGAVYQVRLRAKTGGADGPDGPHTDPPAVARTEPLCLLDAQTYQAGASSRHTAPACPRDAALTIRFTGGDRPAAGREITVGFTNGVAGFKAALAGWQRRGGETPDVVHAGWVNTSTGWRSDWHWQACEYETDQEEEAGRPVCGPATRGGYRYTPTPSDAGKRIRAHVYYIHPTTGSRAVAVTALSGPVLAGKPAPPRNLGAAGGDGSVTLTWDDPGDASITSHKIRWKPSEIRGGQKVDAYTRWRTITGVSAPAGGKRSYTQTLLENGVEYTFQVLAAYAAGDDGDPSAEATATPRAACPAGEHRDAAGSGGCHAHAVPACHSGAGAGGWYQTSGTGARTNSGGHPEARVARCAQIRSFTATPLSEGSGTTLAWTTEHAATVELGAETRRDVDGSKVVNPNAMTSYTLKACNADGHCSAPRTVRVEAANPPDACEEDLSCGADPPAVPVIDSFAAAPAAVTEGSSTVLSWATTGATAVTINNRPSSPDGSSKFRPDDAWSFTPGETTDYTLSACAGDVCADPWTLSVAVTGLAAPAGLAFADRGSDRVTLTWDAPPAGQAGQFSYQIRYKRNLPSGYSWPDWSDDTVLAAGAGTLAPHAGATAATISGLNSSWEYKAEVRAVNGAALGPPARLDDIPPHTPPHPAPVIEYLRPSSTPITAGSDSGFYFHWRVTKNATEFFLKKESQTQALRVSQAVQTTGGDAAYNLWKTPASWAAPTETAVYTLRACTANQAACADSTPVEVTVNPAAPPASWSLRATGHDGYIQLTWDRVQIPGQTSVRYQYRIKPADQDWDDTDHAWELTHGGSVTETKKQVERLADGTRLSNGTEYTVELRVVKGSLILVGGHLAAQLPPLGDSKTATATPRRGASDPTPAACATPESTGAGTGGLSAAPAGDGGDSLKVSWSQSAGAFRYKIKYRYYSPPGCGSRFHTEYSDHPTSFKTIGGLTPGTTYQLKLVVESGSGQTEHDPITATTGAKRAKRVAPVYVAPLGAPAKPELSTSVSGNAVTLEWDNFEGIEEYRYRHVHAGAGSTKEIWEEDWVVFPAADGVARARKVVGGLRFGSAYDFQLRARNSAGWSLPSDKVRATTDKPDAPGAVTGLEDGGSTYKNIVLVWDDPGDTTVKYEFRRHEGRLGWGSWVKQNKAWDSRRWAVNGMLSHAGGKITMTLHLSGTTPLYRGSRSPLTFEVHRNYRYEVRAYRECEICPGGGEPGLPSTASVFTLDEPRPNALSGLEAVPGDRTVTLIWREPHNPANPRYTPSIRRRYCFQASWYSGQRNKHIQGRSHCDSYNVANPRPDGTIAWPLNRVYWGDGRYRHYLRNDTEYSFSVWAQTYSEGLAIRPISGPASERVSATPTATPPTTSTTVPTTSTTVPTTSTTVPPSSVCDPGEHQHPGERQHGAGDCHPHAVEGDCHYDNVTGYYYHLGISGTDHSTVRVGPCPPPKKPSGLTAVYESNSEASRSRNLLLCRSDRISLRWQDPGDPSITHYSEYRIKATGSAWGGLNRIWRHLSGSDETGGKTDAHNVCESHDIQVRFVRYNNVGVVNAHNGRSEAAETLYTTPQRPCADPGEHRGGHQDGSIGHVAGTVATGDCHAHPAPECHYDPEYGAKDKKYMVISGGGHLYRMVSACAAPAAPVGLTASHTLPPGATGCPSARVELGWQSPASGWADEAGVSFEYRVMVKEGDYMERLRQGTHYSEWTYLGYRGVGPFKSCVAAWFEVRAVDRAGAASSAVWAYYKPPVMPICSSMAHRHAMNSDCHPHRPPARGCHTYYGIQYPRSYTLVADNRGGHRTVYANRCPAAPGGVRAAGGVGVVELSWDDPGSRSVRGWQYQIRSRASSEDAWGGWGSWRDVTGAAPEAGRLSHTIGGLAAWRTYQVRVRAFTDHWRGRACTYCSARRAYGSGSAAVSAVASSAEPPAPGGFTAVGGVRDIVLGWDAFVHPAGAGYEVTGYEYQLRDPARPDWRPGWREVPVIPGAPVGLSAVGGDGSVVLSWEVPADESVTGHEVRWRARGGGDDWGEWRAVAVAAAPGGGFGHTQGGLANGVEHQFEVRAVNASGAGAATAPASATPRGGAAAGACPAGEHRDGGTGVCHAHTVPECGIDAGSYTPVDGEGHAAAVSVAACPREAGRVLLYDPAASGSAVAPAAGRQIHAGFAGGYRTAIQEAHKNRGGGGFWRSAWHWQACEPARGGAEPVCGPAAPGGYEYTPTGADAGKQIRAVVYYNHPVTGTRTAAATALSAAVAPAAAAAAAAPALPTGFTLTPEDPARVEDAFTARPGAAYVVKLRARNAHGASPAAQASATPRHPPIPAAPSGLAAAVGDRSITLTWDAPEAPVVTDHYDTTITGYQYRVRFRRMGWNQWRWSRWHSGVIPADATSFTITNAHPVSDSSYPASLDNGNRYMVQLRAGNAYSEPTRQRAYRKYHLVHKYDHAYSSARALADAYGTSRIVNVTLNPAPAGLAAAAGEGEVTLSWDAWADPSVWRYEYRARRAGESWGESWPHSGGGWRIFSGGCGADATSCAVGGLANGVEYRFQVRAARTEWDYGRWTLRKSYTPGAASVEVSAVPECGSGRHRDGAEGDCHGHTPVCGLLAGSYTPIDGEGHAEPVSVAACAREAGRTALRGAGAPVVGGEVSVVFTGGYAATVENAHENRNGGDADGWRSGWLWQACEPAAGQPGALVCEPRTPAGGGDGGSYAPTAADAGKRLRAVVFYPHPVTGARTAAVTALSGAVAAAAPAAPGGLTAVGGDASAVLAWDDPGDAAVTGHEIRWKTDGGYNDWRAVIPAAAAGGGLGHTLRGLENGVAHTFQVRAVNGAGAGEASGEASATPEEAEPGEACPAGEHRDGGAGDCHAHPVPACLILPGSHTPIDGDGHAEAVTVAACPREAGRTLLYDPAPPGGGASAVAGRQIAAKFASGYAAEIKHAQMNRNGGDADGWRSGWRWQACEPAAGRPGAGVCEPRSRDAAGGFLYTPTAADAGKRIRAVVYYPHPVTGARTAAATALTRAVAAAPPAAPGGLTAAGGDASAVLAWDDPADASVTGHEIRWKTTGGYNDWRAAAAVAAPGGGLAHTQTGLANGAAHTFQVRAVNAAGASGASEEATATPEEAQPGEACPAGEHRDGGAGDCHAHPAPACQLLPGSHTPIDGDGHAAPQTVPACPREAAGKAELTGAGAPAVGQQIHAGFAGHFSYRTAIQEAHKNRGGAGYWRSSWHWQTCQPDQLVCGPAVRGGYKYTPTAADAGKRIRAHVYYNHPDTGTRVVAVTAPSAPVLPAAAPAAPTGLAAAARPGAAALTWNDPAHAAVTGHEIRWKTTGAYNQWQTIAPAAAAAPGGGRSHTQTGLDNNTTHTFQVRAVNARGPGQASNEATATTPEPPPPAPPPCPAGEHRDAGTGDCHAHPVPACLILPGSHTPIDGNAHAAPQTTPACPREAAGKAELTGAGAPAVGRQFHAGFASGYRNAIKEAHQNRGGAGYWRSSWHWQTCQPAALVCGPAVRGGYKYTPTAADAGKRIRAHVYYNHPDTGTRVVAVTAPSGPVLPAAPAAPAGLAAAARPGAAALTWNDPAHAAVTGHEIRWKTTGAYNQWQTIAPAAAAAPGGGRSHTQTGLDNNTTHTFQVRAVNARGPGQASNEATATTPPVTPQ